MTEDVDKLLKETNELAVQETSHLPGKHQESAVHGRATRHLSIAENNAALEYYKTNGKHYDSNADIEPYAQLIAMVFVYAIIAGLVNLVLYFPVFYLTKTWGDINSHDAVYVSIIINTAIGAILIGTFSEPTTKRKAFMAGMRAEADNHIVSKYHVAKNKIDDQYSSKGNIPDFDFEWKN